MFSSPCYNWDLQHSVHHNKDLLLRYYPKLRTKSELGRKCAVTKRLNKMVKNQNRVEAMSLLGEMVWREEATSQRTEACFTQWHRNSLEK